MAPEDEIADEVLLRMAATLAVEYAIAGEAVSSDSPDPAVARVHVAAAELRRAADALNSLALLVEDGKAAQARDNAFPGAPS